MSFNISLSGLNAMQKSLDVTSNNIANVATYGFKASRAEFSDVYTTSVMANSKTTVGSGVQTATVSQQFAQGSISNTNNALDLAISGEGFFVMKPEGSNENIYTRAGNFEVDENGYVISNAGYFLQVYDVDKSGNVANKTLDSTHNLQIPASAGAPKETNDVSMTMILNSDAPTKDPTKFDPENSESYTASTSVVVYDSLGTSHSLTYYFVKASREVETEGVKTQQIYWNFYTFMDGKAVDIADYGTEDPAKEATYLTRDAEGNVHTNKIMCAEITFGPSGQMVTPTKPAMIKTVQLGTVDGLLSDSVDQTQAIDINLSLQQFGSMVTDFSVTKVTQDGKTSGQLTGIEINSKGLVQATYSNGTTENVGMIAMATFSNNQGLSKIGDTCWKQSLSSGVPVPSQAGDGTTGTIKSSALESSNVDLSGSLVELIMAQRYYQANSKSLEASSSIMQTILNVS